MERTTEFNLNQELAHWRSQLSGSGHFSQEDLDELQSHLADQTEALTSQPLSQREAILVAKDRIGQDHDLKDAYAKSKSLWASFKIRLGLYLQAMLILMLVVITTQMAGLVSTYIFDYYTLTHASAPILYISILLALFIPLFFYLRYLYRKTIMQENDISFTGYLTLTIILGYIISVGFLIYMTKVTLPKEYFYLSSIKAYIQQGIIAASVLFCLGYSLYHYRSIKLKTRKT